MQPYAGSLTLMKPVPCYDGPESCTALFGTQVLTVIWFMLAVCTPLAWLRSNLGFVLHCGAAMLLLMVRRARRCGSCGKQTSCLWRWAGAGVFPQLELCNKRVASDKLPDRLCAC